MLPKPASLDTIRNKLAARFELNPRVEGLGDVEELDVQEGETLVGEIEIRRADQYPRVVRALNDMGVDAQSLDWFYIGYAKFPQLMRVIELVADVRGAWVLDPLGDLKRVVDFLKE
jgi:hypothetical protein